MTVLIHKTPHKTKLLTSLFIGHRTCVVLLENHGEIILFSASVWCPFFPSFSPSFSPSSSVSFCPIFHFFLFCLYFYFWLLRQQPRSKINIIFFSFQIKIVTLRKVFSPPFKQTMMTQICCIKVLFPLVRWKHRYTQERGKVRKMFT